MRRDQGQGVPMTNKLDLSTIGQLIENTRHEDFQFVLPFKLTKKQMEGLFHQVEIKDDRQTIQVDTDILLEIRGEELVEGKSPSWIAFEEFVDELYWNIDRFADPDNWMDEQSCRKADCECAVDVYAVYDREQREAKANHYGKQRSWFQTKHTVGYQTNLLVKSLNRLLVNVKKLGEVQ